MGLFKKIKPPHPASLYHLLFLVLFFAVFGLRAQEDFTQTIRGKVIDKDSRFGLPKANIILLNTSPPLGTSTDINGNFELKRVPAGRQSLQVSYTGYQTVVLSDLYVSTGKELVLTIELKELVNTIDEVEITADYNKAKPINPMAMISARSFSIEETNKYAGSYGDPARMAANFAGVLTSRDNRNDIIIRGNSPIGVQYRLNGIKITNPNHFGAQGTTGGPVTMLNTNLLANSDFLTGAFPAEYGNALAGVFDLKLRTGNAENHEFWAQMGFNGLEFGLEGPFSKKSGATYLAAYRYSLTDLIEKMGVKLKESARYQDLSFNLNFPTKKAGVFTLFGLGGNSSISKLDSEKEQADWTFKTHGEDLRSESGLMAAGLAHHFFFDEKTSLLTHVSVTGNRVETRIDTFSITHELPFLTNAERSTEMTYSIATRLTKKINAANTFKTGISWELYDVNYADSIYFKGQYKVQTDAKTQFSLLGGFAGWLHLFSNTLSLYTGLHYQYFTLNGSQSLEPRVGLSWQLRPQHGLNLGFGLQSQTQARIMYFVQTRLPDGSYALTNKQMGFSKNMQVVLGYDYRMTEFLRLKAETYYQNLYNIPVKESIPQYSVLNEGTAYFIDRMDSLVNLGSGTNYGLELTLEKFMSRHYFFLFTASVFESKYRGYDETERNTSFNSNFIFNAVGGYEWPFGKKKNRAVVLGLRMTWAGGRPYLPYDREKTVEEGYAVFDWENAYVPRHDQYFRTSFRLGMRRNERKFNMAFLFDIQYRANYTYIYMYRIDVVTGEIVKDYSMGWYPNGTVRIQF